MKKFTLQIFFSATIIIIAATVIINGSVKATSSPSNSIGNITSGYGNQEISFNACLGLYEAYGGVESVQIGFTKNVGNFTGYYYVTSNGDKNTQNKIFYDIISAIGTFAEFGELSAILKLCELNLNINGNLFKNPLFTSLQDHSRPLPDQEIGRNNPFAPIGQ